jgi:hypothetical protein
MYNSCRNRNCPNCLLADLILGGRLKLELDGPRGPPAHRGDEPHYVPYYDD